MTDFVLEQSVRIMNCEITHLESHEEIVNYAKFLKQPLKLEMFVPLDEDGNVLTQCEEICAFECDKIKNYRKAKEKVLFEGFEIYGNGDLYNQFVTFDSDRLEIMNVENLITDFQYSFNLTPNAIKRIFG
jgi:hypothetical protein